MTARVRVGSVLHIIFCCCSRGEFLRTAWHACITVALPEAVVAAFYGVLQTANTFDPAESFVQVTVSINLYCRVIVDGYDCPLQLSILLPVLVSTLSAT